MNGLQREDVEEMVKKMVKVELARLLLETGRKLMDNADVVNESPTPAPPTKNKKNGKRKQSDTDLGQDEDKKDQKEKKEKVRSAYAVFTSYLMGRAKSETSGTTAVPGKSWFKRVSVVWKGLDDNEKQHFKVMYTEAMKDTGGLEEGVGASGILNKMNVHKELDKWASTLKLVEKVCTGEEPSTGSDQAVADAPVVEKPQEPAQENEAPPTKKEKKEKKKKDKKGKKHKKKKREEEGNERKLKQKIDDNE